MADIRDAFLKVHEFVLESDTYKKRPVLNRDAELIVMIHAIDELEELRRVAEQRRVEKTNSVFALIE